MITLNIKTTDSVNGIYFCLPRDMCRELFNLPYEEYPKHHYLNDLKYKDIAKQMMEVMAMIEEKSYEEFMANVPETKEHKKDAYKGFQVHYNDDLFFEAIEINNSGPRVKLIVDGKDCSDFNIKKLLSLSDDFIYDEHDTSYYSYEKSIIIWCPNGKEKVETVLFAHDEYFDDNGVYKDIFKL